MPIGEVKTFAWAVGYTKSYPDAYTAGLNYYVTNRNYEHGQAIDGTALKDSEAKIKVQFFEFTGKFEQSNQDPALRQLFKENLASGLAEGGKAGTEASDTDYLYLSKPSTTAADKHSLFFHESEKLINQSKLAVFERCAKDGVPNAEAVRFLEFLIPHK